MAYVANRFADDIFLPYLQVQNISVLAIRSGQGLVRATLLHERGCAYVGLDILGECIDYNSKLAVDAGLDV